MSEKDRFRKRYETGETPWVTDRPDSHLIRIVREWPIPPCAAFEFGCGTGDNAIWLAEEGFRVTATDCTGLAIDRAREKAEEAGVKCEFLAADFLKEEIPGGPFRFAFDRGCFHSFDTNRKRKRTAENVAAHLEEGGLWFSIIGSADTPPRPTGPPQLTACNIVSAVEDRFEILSLTAGRFDSDSEVPPNGWFCLMRKRRS